MTPFYNPTTNTFYPHITDLPKTPLYNGRELCELSLTDKQMAGYYPVILLSAIYDSATQYLDGYDAILVEDVYQITPRVLNKTPEQIAAEQAAMETAEQAARQAQALAGLAALDARCVRALREVALGQTSSAAYLAQYDAQAAALRAVLSNPELPWPGNDEW